MPTEDQLRAQLTILGRALQDRAAVARGLDEYYEGSSPLPLAVVRARVVGAYRTLMPVSEAPWASLIVDSVADRLEVAGIRSDDPATDDAVWGVWQDSQMDAESRLAHNSALICGRAYATVWPENGGPPQITITSAENTIVQYQEGSRRRRVAAFTHWVEGKQAYATLYRPDGVYKFTAPAGAGGGGGGWHGGRWERREEPGEPWPLTNQHEVVPVVELAVNRRLRPGMFGYARGEFEHCTGLIDRINLLTFLGLVVAFYMGFPLRGVIGQQLMERVLKDDDGNEIGREKVPPFDANAGGLFTLEDPQAKIAEYKAADRQNLSVFAELDQLATISKTPRHYFPMASGMSNLSAEAVWASEGGLHAKVGGLHKPSLGEGWEEVLRLAGLMLPVPVRLSPRAELVWMDHQSRSLAERADAATKLKDVLPWQAVAEMALKATPDQIARWEAQRSSDTLGQLLGATRAGQPPEPEPVA